MSTDHRNVDMKDMQHVYLTYFKINQIKNKTKPLNARYLIDNMCAQ